MFLTKNTYLCAARRGVCAARFTIDDEKRGKVMDIDLVYLWVDGSDPAWVARRNAYIGMSSRSEVNCEGRFADNDELRYSLRSVEMYAPWIRRIFIVTDRQVPRWLRTDNPRVRVVDHTEIIPAAYLPCFSSRVIEHHIHNIPDLSEHFLFANDDMFLHKAVTPATFFAADGFPNIRMIRRPLRKWWVALRSRWGLFRLNNYGRCIHNAALLVEEKYGVYYGDKSHHNIDAYLKSTYRHTRVLFDKEITPTLSNRVRNDNDLQRHLYSFVALAEGRGHACYVSRRTSLKLHIKDKHYAQIARYDPTFFCMNDSQSATAADRQRVATFLATLFPVPSSFETVPTV